uniref:Uncharacterized protein n=1 Tax=Avena sativa TaxID=4498 RepID=A0ACD5ZH47_AVESA
MSHSLSNNLTTGARCACDGQGLSNSTRHLFDGMPNEAAESGKDPFRRLPDEILRHVLSFLPEEDAMQTCVLDTRWRDLWRRATSLDFDFDFIKTATDTEWERFKQIVKLVIQLRGNSPLVKCVIKSFLDKEDAKLWIEYALMCEVRELIVISDYRDEDAPVLCYDAPFFSQHLKFLEFFDVNFEGSSLDFSSCPVLEDLKMGNYRICAPIISSQSLKHMCIANSCTFPQDFRLRIVAPELILLELDDKGLVLNGLSNAFNLELIAQSKMFIYRWDLKWCPVFDKLKTLLLNEWFAPVDLVCILQHSPILEMLTLQLGNTKSLIGATGGQETTKQSFVCAHLKVVNIERDEVDEGVQKILSILRACGILHNHISIKAPKLPSFYFSFRTGVYQGGIVPRSFLH